MAGQIIGAPDSEGINEINITPFVDIVLVLLIIFMISTPALVYRGMRVSLPKVANSEDMSHVTLNVMVAADGKLSLDKRAIELSDLKEVYRKLRENRTYGDAIVTADKAVPHGRAMEVADYLKTLGVEQVGFAVSGGVSQTSKTKQKP